MKFFLLITSLLLSTTAFGNPLRLNEVLESTLKHYPEVKTAINDAQKAKSLYQSDLGFFDPKLKAKGHIKDSRYDHKYGEVSLTQNTPLLGSQIEAGFRKGRGQFAVYDEILKTYDEGEWFAKFSLPLLKGSLTDEERTAIRLSKLDRERFESLKNQLILMAELEASAAYWKWVSAGFKYKAYKSLLAAAQNRQSAINKQVKSGAKPRIDLSDNLQQIRMRQRESNQAKLILDQAAQKLSLYYRDAKGNPIVPGYDQLPKNFPTITKEQLSQKTNITKAQVLKTHPLVQLAQNNLSQKNTKQKLTRNNLFPELNVNIKAAKDYGTGSTSTDNQEFYSGLEFSFPLLNRKARFKNKAQKFNVDNAKQKYQLTLNKVQATLEQTRLQLIAAFEQIHFAKDEWYLARKVEQAERTKFSLGDSDLLKVNIREQYAFKSRVSMIETYENFFQSLTEWHVATGGLYHLNQSNY